MISPINQTELVVDVVTRVQFLPSPMDLMKLVQTHLVKLQLPEIARQGCQRCQQSLAGQYDHMTMGGCLQEPQEMLQYYMADAMAQVPVAKVFQVIGAICAKLHTPLPTFFEQHDAKEVPAITSGDVYTFSMMDNCDYDEVINAIL